MRNRDFAKPTNHGKSFLSCQFLLFPKNIKILKNMFSNIFFPRKEYIWGALGLNQYLYKPNQPKTITSISKALKS